MKIVSDDGSVWAKTIHITPKENLSNFKTVKNIHTLYYIRLKVVRKCR